MSADQAVSQEQGTLVSAEARLRIDRIVLFSFVLLLVTVGVPQHLTGFFSSIEGTVTSKGMIVNLPLGFARIELGNAWIEDRFFYPRRTTVIKSVYDKLKPGQKFKKEAWSFRYTIDAETVSGVDRRAAVLGVIVWSVGVFLAYRFILHPLRGGLPRPA
ncbi:MAG: hypothetical protein A2V83_08100 [Nitrospirae bacterium RBG_16_64_22]|nr:MAG: hypothetical protein A2V83_08100 [Nitrospirae bacterium RBG_16_64_22]